MAMRGRPFSCGNRACVLDIVFTTWWTAAAIFFLCDSAEKAVEFRELPLIMPPSKVCPKCNAVVPIRLKVCKSCQHVFLAKRYIEHTLPARAMK